MLARAAEQFNYRPKRVAADAAYGSAVFLAFVRDRGALPHIPVLERSEQTKGKFPRSAFTFDRERDCFTCPDGKILAYRAFDEPTGVRRYRASSADCGQCVLRKKCTTGKFRGVSRMNDEEARDLARAESRTGLFKRSMRLRRGVERLFADAKSRRGLARLHLRGLRGAEEEFLIGAAVLNLLLLARPPQQATRPRRVPPAWGMLGKFGGAVPPRERRKAAGAARRFCASARPPSAWRRALPDRAEHPGVAWLAPPP